MKCDEGKSDFDSWRRGLGAIVNSSRGIIAAYKQEQYAKYGEEHFAEASRAAVEAMIADIGTALERAK